MTEKKLSIIEMFNIASGQFGAMLGAGFASGIIFVIYFINTAGVRLAPWLALLALVIQFLIYYLGIEICRKYDIDSYKELWALIYGRSGKVMGPMADLLTLVILCTSLVTVLSGTGSYLLQWLGWPIIVGVIGMAIISLVLSYKGTELFNRAEGLMAIAMVVILVIVYVAVLFGYGMDGLAENFAADWKPENASVAQGVIYALMLGTTQATILPVFLLNVKKFNSSKEVRQTLCIGFMGNFIAYFLPLFALLAFVPEAISVDVPTMYLLTDVLKFGPAMLIYSILMLLAYLSTGCANILTICKSLLGYAPKKIADNASVKRYLPIVIVLLAIPLSNDSIMTIANAIAPYTGYASIFLIGLPALFAPRLLKKDINPEDK